MSKTYRVRLGSVRGEGRDERRIVCPKLVPEMPALLGDALAAKGWVVTPDGAKARKRFGTVDATIALDEPALELKAEASVELIGRSYEPNDNDGLGRTAALADGETQRPVAAKQAVARAERIIAQAEPDVRAEVLGAVQVALLEALQRKAAQLGRVQSVERGTDADGRAVTTIKVEV